MMVGMSGHGGEFLVAIVRDRGPLTVCNDLVDGINHAKTLGRPFIVAMEHGLDEERVLREFDGCVIAGSCRFHLWEDLSGKFSEIADMWLRHRN